MPKKIGVFKMKNCQLCGFKMIDHCSIKTFTFESIDIIVPNILSYYCDNCGESFIDEKAIMEHISRQLKETILKIKNKGLL